MRVVAVALRPSSAGVTCGNVAKIHCTYFAGLATNSGFRRHTAAHGDQPQPIDQIRFVLLNGRFGWWWRCPR
jgi:hypothetical protein